MELPVLKRVSLPPQDLRHERIRAAGIVLGADVKVLWDPTGAGMAVVLENSFK